MKRTLSLAALAILAAPASAQGAAPYTIQETGQSFGSLQQAVQAIGGGSGTIVVAPGRYRDCAVQQAGEVAFRAAEPGTAVFDGGACEGKATLVLRGRAASVEGLIFENIRVPDANGAGIRLEHGPLTVRETMFRNSESGILSANDPSARILIERSTFSGLGRCDRGLACAHSIYIGEYGSLTVRASRFERGRGGHYVKTRARRIDVTDSSFDDSAGRTTNYMIDLSGGATGLIARNIFVQGHDKENYSAMITVAPEGNVHDASGLTVTGNTASLAPDMEHGTSFVVGFNDAAIRVEDNRLGARIARFERR
jgi:hypothetical protein